ncbi:MAG: hypothetical protein COV67_06765 [Nitrospinae bacterium CG11_big_fil_rev_8_21_14_0_20_56_8]|nr:MAG: hypothetical protein COV67_06765 [Nitrospinae bacterium CG11_big_fil_rev_8_21_14_0_20_56_8]
MTAGSLFLHPPALDLSIIIVSFNTRDILIQCVESVTTQGPDPAREAWVVDNGSDDGSAEAVRQRFPGVHRIENRENRGFSAALNQAIPQCRGKYLLFLNSDTRVPEGSLLGMIRFLNVHPEYSILSPQILDERNRPCPMRLWEDCPRDAWLKILGLYDSERERDRMPSDASPREVEAVGGSCMMVRRDLLERIGILDEGHFLYNEEDDLCRRARKAGFKICYFPEASIVHLLGRSTHQPEARERVILETYRSNLYFYSKYYSPAWNLALRWTYRAAFVLGMLRSLFRSWTGTARPGADDSAALRLRLFFMKVPRAGKPTHPGKG